MCVCVCVCVGVCQVCPGDPGRGRQGGNCLVNMGWPVAWPASRELKNVVLITIDSPKVVSISLVFIKGI